MVPSIAVRLQQESCGTGLQPPCNERDSISASPIWFYYHHDAYGEFCNFYPAPIHIDGKEWSTSEHYYQAQKFLDHRMVERIRLLATPGEAMAEGNKREEPIRPGWRQMKAGVMLTAVRAKFAQHQRLGDVLLQTGTRDLVEHGADSFWGDGLDGSGRNVLGEILKQVRAELQMQRARSNTIRQQQVYEASERAAWAYNRGGDDKRVSIAVSV